MKSEIRPASATRYTPADLAVWLDRWALRREKVLQLIDIASARKARKFASECRYLACVAPLGRDDAWFTDWYTLRVQIAAFLADRRAASGDHEHAFAS